MRIINTFISDGGEVPEYVFDCLAQARHYNKDVPIDFICADNQHFFNDLKINWIRQDSLSRGTLVSKFNRVCKFKRHGTPNTTYPSPELFWHRTAERIFYLAQHMELWSMYNVFHFENDVLLYHPLSEVKTNEKISVTPMSDFQTTFAFCHIPSHNAITELCNYFNDALWHGEDKLLRFGYDHISEMSLLNMAFRNKLVEGFPTLQDLQNKDGFIYDPGSYGQYFAGTNNGHSEGFTDPKHYIGEAIRRGYLSPKINDGKPETQFNRIFNLHIHSKNLKGFTNV